MTIRFAKGPVHADLPNPSYPGLLCPGRPQIKNATISGRVVRSDLSDGTNLVSPRLTWRRLPKTDFDAMEVFLENTAKRSEIEFDFTDWDGTLYTPVIYWDGLDDFGRVWWDFMSGTIVLRELPS